jgi:multicomponent Na+:H+ antiporter subunit G
VSGELDIVRSVLAWALIGSGAFFVVVSAIGINRMPDVFTRLHAVSVGDTFGAGLMLVGMMVVAGFSLVTVKLILLLLFLWFMNPVATHAIARAALQAGEKPLVHGADHEAAAARRGEDRP